MAPDVQYIFKLNAATSSEVVGGDIDLGSSEGRADHHGCRCRQTFGGAATGHPGCFTYTHCLIPLGHLRFIATSRHSTGKQQIRMTLPWAPETGTEPPPHCGWGIHMAPVQSPIGSGGGAARAAGGWSGPGGSALAQPRAAQCSGP